MRNELSLLIKPAGALCDLGCSYCFYRRIAADRDTAPGVMQDETAETLLERVLSLRPAALSIAFQGGEPTLAGLSWYRRFLQNIAEKNTAKIPVNLSIQTNGMHINDDWARLFKEHGFLVGLSLDGDKATNDRFRLDKNGNSVYERTLAAAELLNKHGVEFNILSVLTNESAYEIERTYADFKRRGFRFLQFIPFVDEGTGQSLTSEAYTFFLKRCFDLWYADFQKGDYISIRHIDNYIRILLGEPPENCAMCGVCGRYYVIEADGSVYPCDFYCKDTYRLGTVFDPAPFDESETHRTFLTDSCRIHASCAACKYTALCRGGCRRDRTDELTKNKYCKAYRAFFDYALERMLTVARSLPEGEGKGSE